VVTPLEGSQSGEKGGETFPELSLGLEELWGPSCVCSLRDYRGKRTSNRIIIKLLKGERKKHSSDGTIICTLNGSKSRWGKNPNKIKQPERMDGVQMTDKEKPRTKGSHMVEKDRHRRLEAQKEAGKAW